MIKRSFINANTCLLRFVLIVAMVLVSNFTFAKNEMYGRWIGSTDNNLELSIVDDCREKYVPYPSAEPRPCFGYLVYGQEENGQDRGYLIMSVAELEDYLEITLEPAFDSEGAKINLRLNYKDNELHISNITNTGNDFAKSLDGKVLTHDLTIEQLRNEEGSVFKLSEEETESLEEGDPDGPVYDGADTAIAETPIAEAPTNSNYRSIDSTWKENLMMALFGILYLAMICHMVYELFIRRRPYKKEGYTKDDMIAARKEAGLPEDSTDDDTKQIDSYLENITTGWTLVGSQYIPTTKKDMDNAEKCLVEAINLKPTNDDEIDAINEAIIVLENNRKRQFNGSKKLIILTIIVAGLIGYLIGSILKVMPFFLLSLGIYYMASLTPTFMLNHIAIIGKDKKSFFGKIIANVFAFIGSAQTITTITKYDDGTKDVDHDNTQHYMFWAIGLSVLAIIAIFVFVWAIFNYIRNYLLYK